MQDNERKNINKCYAELGKMSSLKSYLADWRITFLKNRDLVFRKIASVESPSGEPDFAVNYKDGKKQSFFVVEDIFNISHFLSKLSNDFYFSIITLNSEKNFKVLLEKWNDLIQFKSLSVYFLNPFSASEKKLILHPYTHNKISEPASLKLGLKSLFENVEQITIEELDEKLKAQT